MLNEKSYRSEILCFSTHFYSQLIGDGIHAHYDFSSVKKWTKKLNIFDLDTIFIPINKNNKHWALCVVNFCDREVIYYDSLGFNDTRCLDNIERYLIDEYKEKNKNTNLDMSNWTFRSESEIPNQKNSTDCGVFILLYCLFIRNGISKNFNFNQSQIEKARKFILIDLIQFENSNLQYLVSEKNKLLDAIYNNINILTYQQ